MLLRNHLMNMGLAPRQFVLFMKLLIYHKKFEKLALISFGFEDVIFLLCFAANGGVFRALDENDA